MCVCVRTCVHMCASGWGRVVWKAGTGGRNYQCLWVHLAVNPLRLCRCCLLFILVFDTFMPTSWRVFLINSTLEKLRFEKPMPSCFIASNESWTLQIFWLCARFIQIFPHHGGLLYCYSYFPGPHVERQQQQSQNANSIFRINSRPFVRLLVH